MKNTLEEAVNIIKKGGVILYPTDTIWGLGCDPNSEAALVKINQIKKRMIGKNFLLLINSEKLLNRHVVKIPEICYDLIDYADKPLTIIYPKGKNVHQSVLAEDGSLGIRMIKEPAFLNALITKLKHGLISTSANISGGAFPKVFADIANNIKNEVDFIVDPRKGIKKSRPSQIIKISEKSEVAIIRE